MLPPDTHAELYLTAYAASPISGSTEHLPPTVYAQAILLDSNMRALGGLGARGVIDEDISVTKQTHPCSIMEVTHFFLEIQGKKRDLYGAFLLQAAFSTLNDRAVSATQVIRTSPDASMINMLEIIAPGITYYYKGGERGRTLIESQDAIDLLMTRDAAPQHHHDMPATLRADFSQPMTGETPLEAIDMSNWPRAVVIEPRHTRK